MTQMRQSPESRSRRAYLSRRPGAAARSGPAAATQGPGLPDPRPGGSPVSGPGRPDQQQFRRPWYHGTGREFQPGDFAEPGHSPDFTSRPEKYVYVTGSPEAAWEWADDVVAMPHREVVHRTCTRPSLPAGGNVTLRPNSQGHQATSGVVIRYVSSGILPGTQYGSEPAGAPGIAPGAVTACPSRPPTSLNRPLPPGLRSPPRARPARRPAAAAGNRRKMPCR
jgi:hypothetical protein